MAHFKAELEQIFATIPPSDKFHVTLAKQRRRMENAFPALKDSPIRRDGVPGHILKIYTLNFIAVVYDRYSTGTLKRPTIDRARTLLVAIEEELNIDKNHFILGDALRANDLHLYGYLLLLITNYDNDHQLIEQYTCIMQVKFIIEMFRQFFPRIDVCSVDELETLFKNDDDYIRLYVLAKLAYADMLLNAPQELQSQHREIANLHQINRVYSLHILQRFEGTKHLTKTQVKNIKSAIAELNSKYKTDLAPSIITLRQKNEREIAAETLMSLKKRSNEVLDDQTPQGNLYRFTTNIAFHVHIHITQNDKHLSSDKKHKKEESAVLDF